MEIPSVAQFDYVKSYSAQNTTVCSLLLLILDIDIEHIQYDCRPEMGFLTKVNRKLLLTLHHSISQKVFSSKCLSGTLQQSEKRFLIRKTRL